MYLSIIGRVCLLYRFPVLKTSLSTFVESFQICKPLTCCSICDYLHSLGQCSQSLLASPARLNFPQWCLCLLAQAVLVYTDGLCQQNSFSSEEPGLVTTGEAVPVCKVKACLKSLFLSMQTITLCGFCVCLHSLILTLSGRLVSICSSTLVCRTCLCRIESHFKKLSPLVEPTPACWICSYLQSFLSAQNTIVHSDCPELQHLFLLLVCRIYCWLPCLALYRDISSVLRACLQTNQVLSCKLYAGPQYLSCFADSGIFTEPS